MSKSRSGERPHARRRCTARVAAAANCVETDSVKVLLSDTWAGGGASTFVATLARGLSSRGHVVDVVVGYRDSPAVADYEPYVRQVFRPPVAFNRVVLDGDYDILHLTEDDLSAPFEYARRVRRLGLRVRVVVTAHQEWAHIDRGADAVVYVSEPSQRKAPGITMGSSVIPNGVDTAWLRNQVDDLLLSEDGAPAAVWVGRVDDSLEQKDFRGFGYAIDGLLRLGWRVVVLDGAPPSTAYPAAEQLRRWFGESVVYANQVSNASVIGALLRAGRSGGALISTSRYEAAPFIALEALAVGCPVIVPEISGYRALLDTGHATGYTSLTGLFDVLERRSFTHALQGVPTHLTADDMVTRYLEVYATPEAHDDDSPRALLTRSAVRALSHPRARALRSAVHRRRG